MGAGLCGEHVLRGRAVRGAVGALSGSASAARATGCFYLQQGVNLHATLRALPACAQCRATPVSNTYNKPCLKIICSPSKAGCFLGMLIGKKHAVT